LKLLATRIAIPVFGSIAVYMALEVRFVYDPIQDANSVILVCVTVPFIAGVWWKRAIRFGALASIAVGFPTWIIAILLAPDFPGDLLGLLVGFLPMLVVTSLTQKFDPPVPLRNNDGQEVDFKDLLGPLPLFARSE
jgi:Na+/proline symporter